MYSSTESIKALNHEGIGKVQQKIPLYDFLHSILLLFLRNLHIFHTLILLKEYSTKFQRISIQH